MFELRGGGEPVYRQLIAAIKRAIHGGIYRPGDQLPTVRAVASSLVINPNTVARAFQQLEKEGVIATVVGRGSFVLDTGEEVRRLQAAIVDDLKRLHQSGWSMTELKSWFDGILRALEAEEE